MKEHKFRIGDIVSFNLGKEYIGEVVGYAKSLDPVTFLPISGPIVEYGTHIKRRISLREEFYTLVERPQKDLFDEDNKT